LNNFSCFLCSYSYANINMKAHSISQHHMKVFLDSLSSQGPEEVQQFVHSPISVYQQGNHYIYMGSTDVAGPLLELVHPVTSHLQHPALSYCGPLEQQHIQVCHTPSQQGHQIEMQQNHLFKQDSQSVPHLQIQNDLYLPCKLKPEEGANFWKNWAQMKNEDVWKDAGKNPQGFGRRKPMTFREDVLSVPIAELNYGLCLMTKEARKEDGSSYEADMLFYLFLCIQKYMFDNDRIDNIFADLYYVKFLERLHGVMKGWCPRVSPSGNLPNGLVFVTC
uniref:QRICH1-like domain-containing protein n=1 Tax=Terrapene triunguis TaxID=2587831 RepID=A0A674IDX7_9SAUR